jgi:SAM-dependent MidA family methyltransferase
MTEPSILPGDLPAPLHRKIAEAIDAAGGWIGFDDFMALALYAPGLGYYANGSPKFGLMPDSGSDFVTAPELSPAFGATLARQLGQALHSTCTTEVWEFGAGSGALAQQLLDALGAQVTRYTIVDLSGSLQARQRERLAAHAGKVQWVSELPARIEGVVIGNEVLDAMPVKLLARIGGVWYERGVEMAPPLPGNPIALRYRRVPPGGADSRGFKPANAGLDGLQKDCVSQSGGLQRGLAWGGPTPRPSALTLADSPGLADVAYAFVFSDQPTSLRPPFEIEGQHDYVTEIHPQAEGFIRTLADRLARGAAFFIDYGFPEREYYHPQRSMGTLMCHRGHLVDGDPLDAVGLKDITAHVNFTGIALAGQEAGLHVIGYTSQGRFLLNAGLLNDLKQATLVQRTMAQRLVNEHEMGELFKVIAFEAPGAAAPNWQPEGFAHGDRTHML